MTRAPHQVANGVKALYDARSIGDAAMTAAERFHDNYVLGVLRRGCGSGLRCSGGVVDPHDAQLARCKAVASHQAIAKVIGPDLTIFLVAFVVGGFIVQCDGPPVWPRRGVVKRPAGHGHDDSSAVGRDARDQGIYVAIGADPILRVNGKAGGPVPIGL